MSEPRKVSSNGPDQFIRRERTFPFCGRLIALPTSSVMRPADSDLNLDNQVSIDFPGMPDSLELARSTNYNVLPNFLLPDGVHQYRHTEPLQIPFSFRLHYLDLEFCPQGALTLVKMAARLHSFVLPIKVGTGEVEISAQVEPEAAPSGHEASQERQAATAAGSLAVEQTGGEQVVAPVTCRLEIFLSSKDGIGVCCNGYVRDVNVKLNGPWLRGPGSGYNLPTSGDFSFTFIHRPGHGNSFNFKASQPGSQLGTQPQAYAGVVKAGLYNTRSLVKVASYRGFSQ